MLLELAVSVLLFIRGLVSIDLGVQIPRTQFLDILLNIFLQELLFLGGLTSLDLGVQISRTQFSGYIAEYISPRASVFLEV